MCPNLQQQKQHIRFGMQQHIGTFSYLMQAELGKMRTSNVKNTLLRGNGSSSLFLTSLCVLEMDWSATADWIS
jgi:hypothetical protein